MDDSGNTKDDLKLPTGTDDADKLARELKAEFSDGKELTVTVVSVRGPRSASAGHPRHQKCCTCPEPDAGLGPRLLQLRPCADPSPAARHPVSHTSAVLMSTILSSKGTACSKVAVSPGTQTIGHTTGCQACSRPAGHRKAAARSFLPCSDRPFILTGPPVAGHG